MRSLSLHGVDLPVRVGGIKSTLVNAVDGIMFHEFHGWMRPGFIVPGAGVDEGWFCWERHDGL